MLGVNPLARCRNSAKLNALQCLLRWPSGLSRVSSSITGRITSVLPPRMERNDTFTTFGQWQITCVIKKTMPPNRRPFLEGWKLSASLCVCASAYDELPVHSSLRSISMHLLLSFLFQPSCNPYWSKSQQVANGKGLSTCRFRCSPLPQTTATCGGLFSWWSSLVFANQTLIKSKTLADMSMQLQCLCALGILLFHS